VDKTNKRPPEKQKVIEKKPCEQTIGLFFNSLTNRRKTRSTAANSTYLQVAVQWLNEILCFVSSLVLAVRLVLRNRQLLVAATRYATFVKKLQKKLTIASRSVFLF